MPHLSIFWWKSKSTDQIYIGEAAVFDYCPEGSTCVYRAPCYGFDPASRGLAGLAWRFFGGILINADSSFSKIPVRLESMLGVRLRSFVIVFASMMWGAQARAQVSTGKVFVRTATYGVMAGTLTGLASLAFYRSPGEQLRNVAMGASLGLYTGLFLGFYLIYLQPDPNAPSSSPEESDEDEEAAIERLSPIVIAAPGFLGAGFEFKF